MCIKKVLEGYIEAGRCKISGKGLRQGSVAFYKHNKGILKDKLRVNWISKQKFNKNSTRKF
jgi:hypothetical protein